MRINSTALIFVLLAGVVIAFLVYQSNEKKAKENYEFNKIMYSLQKDIVDAERSYRGKPTDSSQAKLDSLGVEILKYEWDH